ncbi:hypothetical protein HanIR_Chr08g0381641 [Helianthus annuus]|nr:hypothetical protein HanIR_Chr08g0381641 [Helianthus annuus]
MVDTSLVLPIYKCFYHITLRNVIQNHLMILCYNETKYKRNKEQNTLFINTKITWY